MNLLMNLLIDAHLVILMAATAALPLFVIALLVDLLFGRRLAPAYRSLLWTLVAVRLLIPIALPNTLGVPNLWWAMVEGESPHEPWRPKSSSPPRKADSPPVLPAVNVIDAAGADLTMPSAEEARPAPATPREPAESLWWAELIAIGIFMIWPLGALVLLSRSVIGSMRFAARLRRLPVVSDTAITELLEEVARVMLIRRVPKVKYVPGLSAPALFASLRPTLCLPETDEPLSRNELRMVFIHELAHLVRYDGIIAWLLTVVQAVHWFNPFAWVVTRQVAHTRELACDEAVRRFTSTSEYPTYGDLIVRFASARRSVNLGLVGLWFARPIRRLKSRVAACSPERASRLRLPRPVSLLLLAVVACFGLSDRAPSLPLTAAPVPLAPTFTSPEAVSAAEAAMQQYLDPRPPGTEMIEEREYEVAAALTKLAEVDPEADGLHWLLTHIRRDGEDFPMPALVAADRESGKITLRMSRNEHTGFAQALAGIEQSGPWKIDVEIRFFLIGDLSLLGDLDWSSFNREDLDRRGKGWTNSDPATGEAPAMSMASNATLHGSFTTVILEDDELTRICDDRCVAVSKNRRASPKVTLFNNTGGVVRDESVTPYVTGLVRSKDPADTRLRPVISVHSEGSRIELHANVIDSGTIELSCRAVFSDIDSVREEHVPGTDQFIQRPLVHQLVFQAQRHRFEPGQSLVVAPLKLLRDGYGFTEWMCFALTPRWSPATAPSPDVTPYIDESATSTDNP